MIIEQHYDDDVLIRLLDEPQPADPHLPACSSCAGVLESYRDVTGALQDGSVWDERELSQEPKPQTVTMLQGFAAAARAEDAAAGPAVARLLAGAPSERIALLEQHPEWRTAGVVRKLLDAVLKSAYVEPKVSAEWAALAVSIAETLSPARYAAEQWRRTRASAWRELAYALYYVGSFAESLQALDRADAILLECTISEYDAARASLVRAIVYRDLERFQESVLLAQRSGKTFAAFGDHTRTVFAEIVEASVLVSLRRFNEALVINLRVADDGSLDAEARALAANNSALCCRELSRFAEAERLYGTAISEFERLGLVSQVAKSRWGLARVVAGEGRHDQALALFQRVCAEFEESGMAHDRAVASLDASESLLAI
ncbi:MAG TPA: tetratricopeptide repeat protein, partial [Thermoanaerobaculia bacterium]|nr:tetratricopeptide repeat protein [Thermoanaerobaculia bacterium]